MVQSPPIEKPLPETLSLIYDYVKGVPEEQARDIDALGTKMVQVFTVAGVIMGLAGIIRVDGNVPAMANVLLVGALIAYAGVAGAALYHLWARSFQRPVPPDVLWELSWLDSPHDVQWSFIDSLGPIYRHNRDLIATKARSIRWALIAMSAEVALFTLSVLVIRLWG